MNIIDALRDPKVFAPHFKAGTWDAWIAFLAALFALPMSEQQLAIYRQHTGRRSPPTSPSLEAWLVIGRRGGKSFILALIAVFLACFFDWRPFLGPGEVGTIMIVAQDRRGARTIMRFALGLLKSIPMLRQQIENVTQESITLRNNIVIEIHTASFRSVRGYTVIAALLDELAYWEVDADAAQPDHEVLNAIRPSMATIPGALMLCASSPHSRKGALWDAYNKHFAKDGDDILVWQADTRSMNPSVPQSFIDRHMVEDPIRASAEYGATFRAELEQLISREAVSACTSWGVRERAPQADQTYLAFTDPCGGSGEDSMTLCIAHLDYIRKIVVIDALREAKPTFSPEIVASEFSALMKTYGIATCYSDRWGGDWVKEQFAKFGVMIEPAPKTKYGLYLDLLATINSKRVELLEHQRCFNQAVSLERRANRGAENIDHPPGQHDDLINSVAGAVSVALTRGVFTFDWAWIDDTQLPPADATDVSEGQRKEREAAAFQARRLADHVRALELSHLGLNEFGLRKSIWDHLPGRTMIWR
jgi:hypothetical protein